MSPSYLCILFLKQSSVVVLNYVNILGSEAFFFFFQHPHSFQHRDAHWGAGGLDVSELATFHH